MYIANTPITITWPLGKTNKLVVKSDLDIIVVSSEGIATYIVDPLTDWVAPTSTTNGEGSYTFTPLDGGEYLIKLVSGISTNYVVIDSFDLPIRPAVTEKSLTHDVRVLATKSIGIYKPPAIVGLQSDLSWYYITAVTELPNQPNKLLVAGQVVNNANTKTNDLAIYNITTQEYEQFYVAEPPEAITLRDSFHIQDVAVHPITDLIVLIEKNSIVNNNYYAYYSYDYVNWTRCNMPFNTQATGTKAVFWSYATNRFWWNNGVQWKVSTDGISWTSMLTNEGAANMPEGVGFLDGIPGYEDYVFLETGGGWAKFRNGDTYTQRTTIPWAGRGQQNMFYDENYLYVSSHYGNSVNDFLYRSPHPFDIPTWELVPISSYPWLWSSGSTYGMFYSFLEKKYKRQTTNFGYSEASDVFGTDFQTDSLFPGITIDASFDPTQVTRQDLPNNNYAIAARIGSGYKIYHTAVIP